MFLRTFTGPDGQSHPEEHDDPPMGKVEIDEEAGVNIRAWPPGTFIDFHNTPRRQYMITLSGEAEIGYGDGQTRRQKAGDIHFEDDLTGQGHTFRVIGDQPRVYLRIAVK